MHSPTFLATCASLLLCLTEASPVDVRNVLSQEKFSQQTTVAFPGSSEFVSATRRWTVFDPPTYFAEVSAGSEEDVVKTVKLAQRLRVPFLATGGRHGYGTTLGELDNGLAIDLSRLKSVSVDAAAGTVTVGGGAIFDDIFGPISAAGYEMQTGSCSCVGVVGATLGAGIGRYQNRHGLIIDALRSVRLVTANGTVVQVSKQSNPDLFWGMRGAGANFGIVTSATYQLAPQTNGGQVFTVDFRIAPAMAGRFFEALERFGQRVPIGMSVVTLIVYDEASQGAQIISNWVYSGPEAEGRRLMEPIFALKPLVANASMVPWSQLVHRAGFGLDEAFCAPEQVRSMYTASLREVSGSTYKQAFDKMAALYAQVPAARGSSVELELVGAPNAASGDRDTAYPWRDAVAYSMFQMSWSDPAAADRANALGRELRSDFARTSGYNGLAAYVNYAHGDEELEKIYGREQLRRLTSLKRKWDPANVFGFNNALPSN